MENLNGPEEPKPEAKPYTREDEIQRLKEAVAVLKGGQPLSFDLPTQGERKRDVEPELRIAEVNLCGRVLVLSMPCASEDEHDAFNAFNLFAVEKVRNLSERFEKKS